MQYRGGLVKCCISWFYLGICLLYEERNRASFVVEEWIEHLSYVTMGYGYEKQRCLLIVMKAEDNAKKYGLRF